MQLISTSVALVKQKHITPERVPLRAIRNVLINKYDPF